MWRKNMKKKEQNPYIFPEEIKAHRIFNLINILADDQKEGYL
jgi:hypothetical protein